MASLERRLQSLIENPRESLDVEIKDWLDLNEREHQADLVKAVLALANHGGGYIIIGFREINGIYQPTQPCEEIAKLFNQDRINNAVARYANPQIHIECYQVETQSRTHPVIIVPGGHLVPIMCKKGGPEGRHLKQNAYYIRRSGPASEEPQTGQEWADLIRRCVLADKERLVEQIRTLMQLSLEPSALREGSPVQDIHMLWVNTVQSRLEEVIKQSYENIEHSPYSKGYWMAAFSVTPRIEGLSLTDLSKRIHKCEGNETGWPIGIIMSTQGAAKYPNNGNIEAWLGSVYKEPESADFWIANPNGSFAVFRGYQEDTPGWKANSSGMTFDFVIPLWRVGEFLRYIHRYIKEFANEEVGITTTFKWTGLSGRYLSSSSGRYFNPIHRVSQQNEVVTSITIENIDSIELQLPELVQEITRPLYEIFNFFEVPKETIIKELNEMRKV